MEYKKKIVLMIYKKNVVKNLRCPYIQYIVMKKKDALGASVIAPIARTKYFEFSFYFHLKHKIIYVYSRIFTYIIALLLPTCRGLLFPFYDAAKKKK